MKWIKYSIKTTTEAVDFISDMLNEMGIEGIEIEDHVPLSEADKKRMFVDILPEMKPDDKKATVHFYLDPEEEKKQQRTSKMVLDMVKDGLLELQTFIDTGEGTITVSETEDKDWLNNWKEFFKSFRIGEDIVIKPTWEEVADIKKDDLVIEIDPGISFGTGAHETTKLCIEALRKWVKPGDEILDIGCGSGILSIAATKMGAKHAFAIDIDPVAADSARENCETNHIPFEQITIKAGNLIEDTLLLEELSTHPADIVVANILAEILLPLTPLVKKTVKPGGLYLTSGILDIKEEKMKEAICQAGFEIVEITRKKDWVCIAAKRPV